MFSKSLIADVQKHGFGGPLSEFCMHDGEIDYNEVHAVAYGFMVGFDPRKSKFNLDDIPDDYPDKIKDMLYAEHHYYTFGKTAAHCVQATIVFVLAYYGFFVTL